MSTSAYDAIIIGARCAGAPTGMLLARRGYRVLVVDRATFPSDTISTHLLHPPGVARLRHWGLLDAVLSSGCPPVHTYAVDFGEFTLAGSPGVDGSPVGYAPRRTVLDSVLVDAARAAGAEVREGFTVEDLVLEDGRVAGVRGHARDGRTVTERARVVIGADGRHSLVAEVVRPERYHTRPPLLAAYYAYFDGLDMQGQFVAWDRPRRGIAAWPTNDDLTVVITAWPYAEFHDNKHDVEGSFWRTLDLAPEFAERVRAARRETRLVGAAVPNYFCVPYGPGWALVGDAGYNRDFITAQGMQDALRDAESLAVALDQTFTGQRPFEAALSSYQSSRDDAVLSTYEFTCGLASLEPAPPELQALLRAAAGNQEAMDGFARVNAGAMRPDEFFSPANAARILEGADPAA
jgi:2-polyprenyl-6-methoxyphenol hydroxylase-like FAD-dependent oxidoreductase